ncbi:MAG TPA: HlyD family efflux transporter periplasmic adaptor subunit [Pirellulaceae bacterium]|nr:HlyD family efflux transporter periplasmic adaptor subunit [Pirellulaceae bacterium]HMO91053.1 HlyD family efflux transporter periplasmic adaptor subunit [Pirellulaceae bacterium]HMP68168.1 HlyD family efflux transporter periplasmic adaptor subunit [Pirellulaceae bacterium]
MQKIDSTPDQPIKLSKMITKTIISASILCVGFTIMIALGALRQDPADKPVVETTPLVRTFAAVEFFGQMELSVSGQVIPYRETKVAAQVAGVVASRSECAEVGTYVNANDILLTIDQENLLLDKQRLTAELLQSETLLRELESEKRGVEQDIQLAKEEVALLTADKERKTSLKGSVAQSTIEQAERSLINARKSLQSLENSLLLMHTRESRLQAGINVTKALLDRNEVDLARTNIRAPISGVVVSAPVQQGDMVTVGTVVATINDISRLEVQCNLRLDQLEWLLEYSGIEAEALEDTHRLPRLPVEITTRQGPEAGIWQGELSRFEGVGLDERTKTAPIRIDVKNPATTTTRGLRTLVQNSLVNVRIKIETGGDRLAKEFLAFPATAVQPGNFVWVVEDGKLKRCNVKIVNQIGEDKEKGMPALVVVLVNGELKMGDRVVVSPVAQPIVGTRVRETDAS